MTTSKSEKGKCIPNLVKRHPYGGTEQPSKELHVLSHGPTGIINQSEGLPIVMSTFSISLIVFEMDGVSISLEDTYWYLLAFADFTS